MNRNNVIRLKPVLAMLREATELARRQKADLWQFAVDISQLNLPGVSNADLIQLLAAGLIDHGIETTIGLTRARTFTRGENSICQNSCFVLSPKGIHEMREAGVENPIVDGQIKLKPVWNPETSELRIAGQLVKRFRWRAPNQEQLIVAFEEKQWPLKMEDPFLSDDLVNARRRLHDTVKCLNRRHHRNLLRFHGDGTGQGVYWRISDPEFSQFLPDE